MELDSVIKGRVSIRQFKNLEVPWQFLAECLDAARYAPSSGNIQNSRFIVVKENVNNFIKEVSPENEWAVNAPVLVVVCSEMAKIRRMFSVRGEALYSVQNCACAIQNMLLKAYELGLGSCWIGDFNETKVNELLNISGDTRPQAIIAIGYPDEKPEVDKEPLDNLVFFESYGNRTEKSRSFSTFSNLVKKGIQKTMNLTSKKKY